MWMRRPPTALPPATSSDASCCGGEVGGAHLPDDLLQRHVVEEAFLMSRRERVVVGCQSGRGLLVPRGVRGIVLQARRRPSTCTQRESLQGRCRASGGRGQAVAVNRGAERHRLKQERMRGMEINNSTPRTASGGPRDPRQIAGERRNPDQRCRGQSGLPFRW